MPAKVFISYCMTISETLDLKDVTTILGEGINFKRLAHEIQMRYKWNMLCRAELIGRRTFYGFRNYHMLPKFMLKFLGSSEVLRKG
jgi:hypothetical protein